MMILKTSIVLNQSITQSWLLYIFLKITKLHLTGECVLFSGVSTIRDNRFFFPEACSYTFHAINAAIFESPLN